MCVGIPMKVLSVGEGTALCEGRNGKDQIDTMMVGEVEAGSWILAWNHKAIKTLTEEKARQTDEALNAVEAIMNGRAPDAKDVADGFGDLMRGQAGSLSPEFLKSLTKK